MGSTSLRRVLVATALSAFLAAGCVRASKPPSLPEQRDVRETGLVGADHRRRCQYEVIARPRGGCSVMILEYQDTPDGAAPLASEAAVTCGESVEACGESVRCDCAHPVEAPPCAVGLEPFAREYIFDDGDSCHARLRPPSEGECLLESVYLWREGGIASRSATIPFGQTRPICRGRLQQRCACEEFSPIGSPPKCSYRIMPPRNGRCVVKYTSCTPKGCGDLETWVAEGASERVCGEPLRCAGGLPDGGVP